jgi:hypothetical protein
MRLQTCCPVVHTERMGERKNPQVHDWFPECCGETNPWVAILHGVPGV